ncbi:hypothetical protein DL765_006697 [Monosporascus sp. GIB2]|nr:hypothetical protein DL765_006697 [Monosporascus sp. GIB2]
MFTVDSKFKQNERAERVRALTQCHGPFTAFDREVIGKPIEELVRDVHGNVLQPTDILRTYGRVALRAHEKTNCLTEVMVSAAEGWVQDGSINFGGPLAGIPVSLKDTIIVGGFDTTVGYSGFVGNKEPEDGAIVRLLKDAGAVPYVKTNLPITMLSFESTNDVWGRCTNPHNSKYSPGGSTGGEAALLALGGRIGIGSDVAGSVRAPAHFSGIYSLRCSIGRWPKMGICTSMPGQEGVPSVYSPMARTLNDLTYFTRSIIEMQPWKYDPSVHPLAWRPEVEKEYAAKTKLRVGIMRTDSVVDPSPACTRALEKTEAALRSAGHEIVEIDPPSPYEALYLGAHLLNADGCKMFKSFFRYGERNDPGAHQLDWLMRLPRPFKYLYYLWVKYVRRDDIWAGLIQGWHEKTAFENWKLVAKREAYRYKWFQWWNSADVDFLLTPPNATPAVPHGGMKDAVSSCGYTFLFNVDLDKLPIGFNVKKLNGVAQGAYKLYSAEAMHGLPVGVQIVGRRLEEEKVLAIMKRVEEALGEDKQERPLAYQNAASFVPKLAGKIMQWLDPQKDDVILDIGCGDGVLNLQIHGILAQGNGRIHGIDSSPAMIEAASKAAESAGASKCTFEGKYPPHSRHWPKGSDANPPWKTFVSFRPLTKFLPLVTNALDLIRAPRLQTGAFTKAFSNAALHWVLRAPAAAQADFFRGVRSALAPGGVFAFEMGGLGNVAEMRAALLMAVARRADGGLEAARRADPWFFPDEAWITEMMERTAGGWRVDRLEREYRPTPATDLGGVEAWVRLMGAQFFEAVEEGPLREECVKEVVDVLECVCRNPSGGFQIGYVRLRVLATKI